MDMKPIDMTTVTDVTPQVAEAARDTVRAYVSDPDEQAEVMAMLGIS